MQPINSYLYFEGVKCLHLPCKVLEYKSPCGLLDPEVMDLTFLQNVSNYI